MKRYEAILFDIDDTLLDFKQSEHVALEQLLASYNVRMTDEVKLRYVDINTGLWRAFERGEVDRDEVLIGRHTKLFDSLGLTVDGPQVEQQYRDYLHAGVHMVDGALEVVQKLSNDYPLYIVTNGVTETQFKRLDIAGGRMYGLDTCWFNPNEVAATIESTYEIQHLNELKSLLYVQAGLSE